MNKHINRVSKVILGVVYLVLFFPIVIVIIMSFSQSKYQTFPITFTFDWYIKLFTKSELFTATVFSLILSLAVALVAMIIGVVTAVGMRSMNKKLCAVFSSVIKIPIIIPWLVLSVSLLILFNVVGIGRSYLGLFLGNLIVTIPYVVMLVFGRMSQNDFSKEDAARTLGAKTLRILFTVTLPQAFPAILSGTLMAFVVCFNNFVLQYYLAPFGKRTLPMEIYTMVRVGCEPDINALAAIIILFTVIPLFIIYKIGYSDKIISGKKQ